ncbi:hypothetical protein [Ferruginibacter sp.]
MKTILITVLLLCSTALLAQKKHAVQFDSYNSGGVAIGKLAKLFAAQTENGIAFKNWFAGLGFGIDNYYVKTLPLYGAVKKIFPVKRTAVFLYADIGGNFIAGSKSEKASYYSTLFRKGGFYADAGAGYMVSTGKSTHIFLSIGNAVKHIEETEKTYFIDGPGGVYDTKRKFSRIVVKLGFQF